MSICDRCIHDEVCGLEDNHEEAMTFCADMMPKIGHCKDCKWWRDSDGVYRRGVEADSRCPINLKEVYEGIGYCFMFEPQKGEVKE